MHRVQVPRSPRGLERMMPVFVEVFDAFGLTIFESKALHADSTCASNTDSLQRHGVTVPLDNPLHLIGRRRH